MAEAGRVQVGVDGCRAGWIAVSGLFKAERIEVFAGFASLLAAFPQDAIVAVDMPIGLPERAMRGGRGPEQAVRAELRKRRPSIFSIPARAAIYAESPPLSSQADRLAAYRRVCAVARQTSDPPRGVSLQAFGIFPKIREIDRLLTREHEARVFETHPELAFWRLNAEREMEWPKANPAGLTERRDLLIACGFPATLLDGRPPRGAAEDDRLDAAACFMIAQRIAAGAARPYPDPPSRTESGARMAIWV